MEAMQSSTSSYIIQNIEKPKSKKLNYLKYAILQLFPLLSCVILILCSSILSYWNMVFTMLILKIIG